MEAAAVFAAALLTALATGLGALPFAGRRPIGLVGLGVANALAAGVMLGASAALFVEGADRSVTRVGIGAAAGVTFLVLVRRLLAHGPARAFGGLSGDEARSGLLLVVAMTVHSAAEGVGVGAGFGGGEELGWLLTLAIAVHNIPEGVAISLVLVPRGASVRRAAAWSVLTSLPQPFLAVPAFLFVERFELLVPAGLGFAGGAMTWLAARELVPEALEDAPARLVVPAAAGACAAMITLQLLLV